MRASVRLLALASSTKCSATPGWPVYGPQVQQAWLNQLVPDGPPPEFDPDEPF